jgi:deazaflavin-dependent oxidoreductase (nitroreductase family)
MPMKDSIPRAMVRFGVLAEITVVGRSSGRPRTAVINKSAAPGGGWYVAAGKDSHQWARNHQAAGRCRLRVGGTEAEYVARELSGDEYAEAVKKLAPPFARDRVTITGPAFHLTPASEAQAA